ncbi:MAG: hypothetical protein HYS25_06660 [Ignavibacteriales bacterium]|nr:hypothetical protein [Ignavibacteriales bacterium]
MNVQPIGVSTTELKGAAIKINIRKREDEIVSKDENFVFVPDFCCPDEVKKKDYSTLQHTQNLDKKGKQVSSLPENWIG